MQNALYQNQTYKGDEMDLEKSKIKNISFFCKGFALAALFTVVDTSPSAALDPVPKDNTAHNSRDASGTTLTPLDQSNDQKDIDVTASIRKAILDSDKFSTYGDNIKIITTADGRVTLRGPVRTSTEVMQIVEIAKQNAPSYQIVNQLEVAPRG